MTLGVGQDDVTRATVGVCDRISITRAILVSAGGRIRFEGILCRRAIRSIIIGRLDTGRHVDQVVGSDYPCRGIFYEVKPIHTEAIALGKVDLSVVLPSTTPTRTTRICLSEAEALTMS